MPKTLSELHAALAGKFGEAIVPFAQPEIGDAWIEVEADSFRKVIEFLNGDESMKFDYLRCLSGVDYPPDRIEGVYHLFSYALDSQIIIKVKLDRANPEIPSVMDLWPAAEWHEMEAYDMLGIKFPGHKNLRRILLPEDWTGFPLRKDYKQPDSYHGISNW